MSDDILWEDVAYGIYDRPGPTGSVADIDKKEEDTVPDGLPVMPTNQMANQLSVQRPPIEDEDYVPTSVEELTRAASAVAQLVPASQIEFYYRQLHRLLDDASDREGKETTASSELTPEDSKSDDKKQVEESTRKKIKNILKEMLSDTDKEEFEKYRTGGVDYFGDNESLPVSNRTTSDEGEGKTLEQVAAAFGEKPGKIANEQTRILRRMEYFIQNIKDEDLEGLVQFATGEYIETMLAGDFIDEQDAADLRKLPTNFFRSELPSFGFFFVQSFVLPAYREIVREATDALKAGIENLGVPEVLHQTLYNQITGATPRKPEVIVRKLEKLVKSEKASEKITPKEAIEIVRKIETARPKLSNSVQYSDDLIQRALDKWSKTSKGARIKAVTQALSKTEENLSSSKEAK